MFGYVNVTRDAMHARLAAGAVTAASRPTGSEYITSRCVMCVNVFRERRRGRFF